MLQPGSYKGCKLAVMGLDKTGLSTVAALKQAGATVIAFDNNPAQNALAANLGAEIADLETVALDDIESLLLSPGIPHHLPAPHPVAARFMAAGIEIISDIELFARSAPKARIVAITGTNGKSTTTALTGHIIKSANVPVAVGGNIGIPVLDLPVLPENGVYVIELSSYQLERCPRLSVDVAIMLNLTTDHLARHGDMEGYRVAKANIFRNPRFGATAIYGTDDEWTKQTGEAAASRWRSFPLSLREATPGAWIEGTLLHDAAAGCVMDLATCPTLPGLHNAQNAAAAWGACRALGLNAAEITAGLASYPGLPHRQQKIDEWQGLSFVNDSKATNADSTAKALVCYKNIYWLAGGRPKEGGLNGLEPLMGNVRRAFLLGEAEDDFAKWCDGKVSFERCGNLANALKRAVATAKAERLEGATILLSPACASWDQFKSFEHRGESFALLVHELTDSAITARSA